MAEIKLGGGLELAHSGHTWEQTVAAIFMEPLVAIIARTAEIMLLAGAFQTAANVTGMVSLKVFAGVMYFMLVGHLYMTFWRYIVMPLNRTLRLRGTFLNLILIVALSAALIFLCQFLLQQVVDASKHLVLVC